MMEEGASGQGVKRMLALFVLWSNEAGLAGYIGGFDQAKEQTGKLQAPY
jgi:hypothetical protein